MIERGNYRLCREAFLSRATKLLATRVRSYQLQSTGREGEELSIDTCLIKGREPEKLLVVISGTHGVEGYCGSIIQQTLLELASKSTLDVSVLLIHALNPFGFSWNRRVNEDNIDINRNALIDFSAPYDNSEYAEISKWLVPSSLNPEDILQANESISKWILKYGEKAFLSAVSRGQYDFPKGLFYGGADTSKSLLVLNNIIQDIKNDFKSLYMLDIHSGLGAYGAMESVLFHSVRNFDTKRLEQLSGIDFVEPGDGVASTDKIRGTIYKVFSELPICKACIALEFGTYSPHVILNTMRKEAISWELYQSDKCFNREPFGIDLLDVFIPQSRDWLENTKNQGVYTFNCLLQFIKTT